MSVSIQDLRERRNVAAGAARKLLDDNPTGKWTAENQTAFDALEAEITSLDQQIANHKRVLDREAEQRVQGSAEELRRKRARDLADTDPRRIYDTWLRHGDAGLSAEQAAALRNTMSTTTPSQGGYTVESTVAATIIEQLKAFGGMRQAAEVFSTTQGADINYPTSDGTSEVGELIAQNTTATALDAAFGTVTLSAYKFSSKIVAVPFELLQDSIVDIEAFIRRRLATRLGRVTNSYYTNGTGISQPNGLITAATSGKVGANGQTVTVIYDDLVDLEHSVDPLYRQMPNVGWMMADNSVRGIRKLKDTTGRPIWTPSYEAGITQNLPQLLLGYPITINQDVPVMAANAKSILFGDINYAYKIRDVMDITMFRFTDSAYAKLGQVGFLAWMRSGGTCVDTSAVKYYQNSAA